MELPPLCEKLFLLVADHLHGAAQVIRFHPFGLNKDGNPVRADQINLGLSITEHMHMGWLMIVCEDDDALPVRPIDCDHG
jgi:hypothetical protein